MVALGTSAYAVANADCFTVHRIPGSQWESIALAGIAVFTAVYHRPDAVTARSSP